jgi:outer membrane lipoprotein SlyB
MKTKTNFLFFINLTIPALIITLFTSCARYTSPDVYTSQQAGEVATTYLGTIKTIREVNIKPGDQLGDNALGGLGGGVTGGIAGNAIGKGHFVPTAAGVLAGAVAGTFLESKLKSQTALEYIVELDNGNLITVVQGKEPLLNIFQPVYVIISTSGRSRIIPQ